MNEKDILTENGILIRKRKEKKIKGSLSQENHVRINAKKYSYKLQNIVTSCHSVSSFIDLFLLSEKIPNATYEPNLFPGLSIRLYDPHVTLSLFKSGKVNCTGSTSFEEVNLAFKTLKRILKLLGFPFNENFMDNIECFNMVTVFKIKGNINLENLYHFLPVDKVQYEPETFPGLVFKLCIKANSKLTKSLLTKEGPIIVNKGQFDTITALIFYSGKIVVTGFRHLPKLEEYIKILIGLIETKKFFIKN